MLYRNRKDAGEKLATFLSVEYRGLSPIVLGIPRGGVEIALYVAKMLNSPMTLLISRKLSMPPLEEYGFGALAEESEQYIAPFAFTSMFINNIEDIIQKQAKEITRRIKLYRNGEPLIDMKGKTVILVDDGIATGVTLVPAIGLCRKKGAGKVVIAAPVSGTHFDEHLLDADEIMIPERISSFRSVSEFYEDFEQVTDEQVIALLQSFESR